MSDSENFYHCIMCRAVSYLEETDKQIMAKCKGCGDTTTHFLITPEEINGRK